MTKRESIHKKKIPVRKSISVRGLLISSISWRNRQLTAFEGEKLSVRRD